MLLNERRRVRKMTPHLFHRRESYSLTSHRMMITFYSQFFEVEEAAVLGSFTQILVKCIIKK